jgi:hypothetical protein
LWGTMGLWGGTSSPFCGGAYLHHSSPRTTRHAPCTLFEHLPRTPLRQNNARVTSQSFSSLIFHVLFALKVWLLRIAKRGKEGYILNSMQ